MRVGLELGDGDRIGEAVAVELLGVVTGGINSVEEPLLGEGGKIGEEGAVELLGVVTGDDGVVEVPSPMGEGGVSTPWISIPPAATGGEGRIGEEGAVELLGVVTWDIRFFGNKNYLRCVITAHQTNCSFMRRNPFLRI
jgi:hypothetical protein